MRSNRKKKNRQAKTAHSVPHGCQFVLGACRKPLKTKGREGKNTRRRTVSEKLNQQLGVWKKQGTHSLKETFSL
jgi:hypothetical protein